MSAASGAKLDAALADLGWLDMLDEIPDICNTFGVPAARRDGRARAGAQRRRAARRRECGRRDRAAALRRRLLGASGSAPTRSLRRWTTSCRYAIRAISGRRDRIVAGCTGRGPASAGLVAGRHQPGDAVTGTSARAGPGSIRPSHRIFPGGAPPARRDTRRHRRRRGHPAGRRRTNPTNSACLLAKAAAGQAALTTARHCQQVLGGIGFTAEHQLHRHVKRR